MMNFFLTILACVVAVVFFSCISSVSAFIGVPSLEADVRCPACVAFAVGMRRASWEAHPPFEVRDRKLRRKLLNNDERCMEVLTEGMDILLQRQKFVFFKPPLPPAPHYENALLFTNKTDAPAGSEVRFWSLQDLYLHRRLQVAEFRAIREEQERNSDESLMHFLHNEIREELGEEAEALCYLDLFHSRNFTVDDYYVAPQGEGSLQHLTLMGRWADPPGEGGGPEGGGAIAGGVEESWLQMNILKDKKVDEDESMIWVAKLCQGKTMCGEEARKKGIEVNDYMRSLLPIVPPFSEPKAYNSGAGDDDDSEKPLMNEDF